MSYSVNKIDIQDAYNKVEEYEYALLYMMSEMILSKVEALDKIDWEQCLEARFFSEDKELHIYEDDGEYMAVEIQEEKEADTLIKKYELANRFKGIGKSVCVSEYISYDEDGQAYVSLTRLSGIE